jgi:hypothetical protein
MADLDKIYECMVDKTYQNKTEFEIILSKIEERELAIGFMFDLLLKHSLYEVDKQMMLELMADTLGKVTPRDFIKECHSSFLEKIVIFQENNLTVSMFVLDALNALYTGTTKDFKRIVADCKNKEYLGKLKENLLEAELYEFIGIVDKYLL